MTCVTSLYRLGIDVGQVATYVRLSSLVLLESIILRLSTSLLFILFMLFAKNAVSVTVYKTLSKWYCAHIIFQ